MYLMLTDEIDRRNLILVDSVKDAKRLCKYEPNRFYGYEHIETIDSYNINIMVNEAIIDAQDRDFFENFCYECEEDSCLDCPNGCDLSKFG